MPNEEQQQKAIMEVLKEKAPDLLKGEDLIFCVLGVLLWCLVG